MALQQLLLSLACSLLPAAGSAAAAAAPSSSWPLLSPPLVVAAESADKTACTRCASDWAKVNFVGVGAHNQTDLCSLVGTCASEVAECDFNLQPDEIFATCKNLKNTSKPLPTLRQFKGAVTGRNTSAYYINQTAGSNGPFVLFIAPQTGNRPGGDYTGWACYYLFSYLATQGIAVFTANIPDPYDMHRDNWNRVPSQGERPYPYNCAELDFEGPSCDNSTNKGLPPGPVGPPKVLPPYYHDQHIEDVIMYAESLGYSANQSVWWGFSSGATMVSQHLNYLLQRGSSLHIPKAMVLESSGGQYCFAFKAHQQPQLQPTPFWSQCTSWDDNNCCPKNLTEQYYFEHPHQYRNHPAVLLVSGDSDECSDPNGPAFYHDTLRSNSARSASASWSGSQHGISPIAFGFAASYIKNSLLNSSHYTKPSMSVLKSDDLF